MEKNLEQFWNKLPKDFTIATPEKLKQINVSLDEFNRAYEYENETIIFSIYDEDGEEFVNIYEQQMQHIENKINQRNWKKISPIKPIFHKWSKIQDKDVYFSVFESYNNDSKVSLQMFVDCNDFYVGITTALTKQQNILLDDVINNVIIKKILEAII